MADVLPDGLNQFQLPLEQWFFEMPICTRIWTSLVVATSVLVQCNVLTPFQLFYSVRAVFVKNQYWRLLTTFFYFGPLSLDLLLHVFFLQRYSRLLEESSGRSPAQYSWLLAYAISFLLLASPMFSIPFLGQALSSTLVYIWSRRNPDTRLSFLGLFIFKAPFLPWVLMAFSFVMHGHIPKDELCGIVVGHIYYYFSDVFPALHGGLKPLDPPVWWQRLWDGQSAHDHDDDEAEGEVTGPEQDQNITAVGNGDRVAATPSAAASTTVAEDTPQ